MIGAIDIMTSSKDMREQEETEPENTSDDQELDLSDLEKIVGGAGRIDEVALQNNSTGNSSGWWTDPNL